MDDILPTFVSRYQLPTFPLPLFVSELEDPDLLPTFVSMYQLPLFVSRLDKPTIFTDDSTTTSEVSQQSLKAPTYVKSNNIGLNDKLFELGIRKTSSRATEEAHQRHAKRRRGHKHVKKHEKTKTSSKDTIMSLLIISQILWHKLMPAYKRSLKG